MPSRIARAAGLIAALCLAATFGVQAAQLQSVSLESGSSGTRAEIVVDTQGRYRTLALTQPDRLVVDFEQSTLATGLKLPAASGLVTSVRTGNPTPGTVRVVFELSAPVPALPPQWVVGAQPTLVLQWPGATPTANSNPPPVVAAVSASNTAQRSATPARTVLPAVPRPVPRRRGPPLC
jgi:Localisation of periplasmic protein complexes.